MKIKSPTDKSALLPQGMEIPAPSLRLGNTHTFVLKFTNKGVLTGGGNPGFEFSQKKGCFATHLRDFGEKGVDSQN